MTFEQIERHHEHFKAYCRTCTDLQLENIIKIETKRIKDHGDKGEIPEAAKIMLYEAKSEIERRGN